VTPYYSDDLVTLYHGDCLEITEWLTADVLVTDPPYGEAGGTVNRRTHKSRHPWLNDFDSLIGDDAEFDPTFLIGLNKPTALWGANHFAHRLPPSRGWIVWDKATRNGLDLKQAEIEFGWTNFLPRPKCFRHMWSGAFKASERGERYHPTQKPVVLSKWLIGMCPPGLVADPFAGSGSTLVAAKALGRKAIGVEIDERYCETAAKRLAQDAFNFEESA
jgi:DNA modification methylase